jgi:hypothetical protein
MPKVRDVVALATSGSCGTGTASGVRFAAEGAYLALNHPACPEPDAVRPTLDESDLA